MSHRSTSLLRAVSLLGLAAFLSACSDLPTEGPDDTTPTMSVSDGDVAGDYVMAVSAGQTAAVSAAITAAGGSIVRSHPEADILIVSGLSDGAAASISGMDGVHDFTADVMIDGAPTEAGLQTVDADPAGHDPTTAFFFPFQWDMQIIDADDAWAAGYSGDPSVTVAILDTGIDPVHSDLAGLVDGSRSTSFVFNANPLIPIWADDHYHGTHVAGTVASNGFGTSGVAPHTTLMSVKVCGAFFGCPFSAILSGIIHAANNDADVINMSLGGFIGKSFPGGGQLNGLLNRVMNYANQQGVVVVSAAGNSGLDLAHLGRDFGAGDFIATPCESGNGMCVGATGPSDVLAGYSNYGRGAVDVVAPGGDFAVTGNPFTSTVLAPCNSNSLIIGCGPFSYLFLQGTSMATPHVAGLAAMLIAQGSSSAGQIKAAIKNSTDDLGKKGTDALYAHGRINVLKAVN